MTECINSYGYHCDEHWAKQIELCLHIAVKAHAGQLDQVGLPAILHPLEVGKNGNTPLEMCVGFLHDTMEDTEVTAENLLAWGVDKEIVECVEVLTHDKTVSYADYIQTLIDSGNRTAICVKYNDLSHNSDRALTYGFDKQYSKCEKALDLIESSCPWMNILDGKNSIPSDTFLMRWNPTISNFKLQDYEEWIHQDAYPLSMSWSIHDWKKARIGDYVYMLRTGVDTPKPGLIFKGKIVSYPYKDDDWKGTGTQCYYVDIECEDYIGAMEAPIICTGELEATIPGVNWEQGHSGELLTDEQVELLDVLWNKRSLEREFREG